MPQTRSTATSTAARPDLPPAPVGIFLPPPHPSPVTGPAAITPPAGPGRGAWCGVQARDVAALIATYTRPGDLVGDLDEHPTIAQAADYLGRRYIRLLTPGVHQEERAACPVHSDARPTAALILARLPRADADCVDLHNTTRAMHRWRTLLRPGGYLLVALTATRPYEGGSATAPRPSPPPAPPACLGNRSSSYRWRRCPSTRPRAMPDIAAITPPALLDGRHQPAHIKLLAFQHRAGGTDA